MFSPLKQQGGELYSAIKMPSLTAATPAPIPEYALDQGLGLLTGAYLPDFSLISAMSPFTTTVVPNGRDRSANRFNM
jgi:hypothetical protein